jgi:Leucine-rich repeat (LRR) protein
MGLQELPYDFGQLTPNLRTVNLNFNSLQDLRPLLNIKRLNELLVAGNKLSRLRTNLAVLGKLPTLEKLDMRDNPLTLRFYAPTSENRLLSLRPKTHAEENDADRFVLPDGDPDVDNQYLQRLDFETRLRRRVQEIMLSTQCRNLRELDGLPFDKARVLVKDDIWDRLSYLGVIRKAEGPSRITNGDESYV